LRWRGGPQPEREVHANLADAAKRHENELVFAAHQATAVAAAPK
jgi:hypothetical protein